MLVESGSALGKILKCAAPDSEVPYRCDLELTELPTTRRTSWTSWEPPGLAQSL